MITNTAKTTMELRMLARRVGSTWETLAMKKGLDLTQGRVSEPKWGNQRVEIAIAHLLMETSPHRLFHVSSSVWLFNDHGLVDDQHAMKEILLKLDEPPAQRGKDIATGISKSDLIEICALLKVQSPE